MISFYFKLAVQNIRNNKQTYIPYMLTSIGIIAMNYVMYFLACNDGILKMAGGADFMFCLHLGVIVIDIFSLIFLFYTNKFVFKRRQKEIGVYNILGMDKGNLMRMITMETIITCGGSLVFGLFFGAAFAKLFFMILCRLVDFEIPLINAVSFKAIYVVLITYIIIYFLILVSNNISIARSKTIELIKGSEVGEREPKTKHFKAIMGVIFLGTGYAMSVMIKNPILAIIMFFIAVICVIIGTFFLFEAGSIALLKYLRKNENFYYQKNAFLSISTMIYRMKQNAKGLANICILATMVIVMVSGTISLFYGVEDATNKRYPNDVEYDLNYLTLEQKAEVEEAIMDIAAENKAGISNYKCYSTFNVSTSIVNGVFNPNDGSGDFSVLSFTTTDSYYEETGRKIEVKDPNKVVVLTDGNYRKPVMQIGDYTYEVERYETLDEITGSLSGYIYPVYIIIYDNEDKYFEAFDRFKTGSYHSIPQHYVAFDIDGDDEVKTIMNKKFYNYFSNHETILISGGTYRLEAYESSMRFYGGFLFVGLFLGVLFIIAIVLIMYYKQIVEGYDDRERFAIMHKIGLSEKETKDVIKSQIIKIFFLPLGMAILHYIFATPMLTRMLGMLNLTNTQVFVKCSMGTIMVFSIIYILVYLISANEYYKIVSK